MKRLIVLGGPMGVGKTATCRALQARLPNCVFLDGDWCWDARPFTVTAETKAMALDNIVHLLRNFLACGAYETVLFCWVLPESGILEDILSRLPMENVRLSHCSLVCTEEALRARILGDVAAGDRTPDVLDRALSYLPLYGTPGGDTIDTTDMTAAEAAEAVLARL